MSSESFIPKIDLSNLIKFGVGSDESLETVNAIKKASEEVGFFTVTNHGISIDSINNILDTARNFFHLPLDKKITIAPKKWNDNTDTVYRGYFPSEVNGKEGLDIGDPLLTNDMIDLIKKEKFEVNHDMSLIDKDWSNTIDNYYDQVFGLGINIFQALISCFTPKVELAHHAFQRPKTLSTLRFNYYPEQDKPVEISSQDGVALGCETHVDSGIMTILYQDKKGGLQVQNRHTLEWHDVPHDPDSYVVNSGLALQYLTNGYFKATNHRVLFNKEERISIPFFFEPSYDFDINPKHLEINDKPIYEINNYEEFLTNSLKKFVEYDRP